MPLSSGTLFPMVYDKAATTPGYNMPLTQHQLGSAPAPRPPLDKQRKEAHATHSFEWCSSDMKLTNLTCNQAGTVEDSLKKSAQFRGIAAKNQNRELFIIRDGKAISSHCPCSLIKDKRLTVKYIKAIDKLKGSDESRGIDHPQRKRPSNKLVMFHLLSRGGENVKNIMMNPEIKKNIASVSVYAYKGEKVKHALKRDGRLMNTVFKKNCALSDTQTEIITEMSNPVDDLDGKTFKIILLNKSSPPESQPGSLDDAYILQDEPLRSDSDGNQDSAQQSATTESVNDNTPTEKPKIDGNMTTEKILCEIPNSKKMQRHLSSQFKGAVKGMKTQQSKLSRIQNHFRVEFGKNAQTCREVKTMKKLMDLSDSVCHVRINGRPGGSGFLLFDNFVLTNGHVVKNIYNENTGQLDERVTVHFSYESLDQMDSGAEVEEVAGFEYCHDESGRMYDWALLKLGADQTLRYCLLKNFGFLPHSGGICIIGHPDGGVKKIDPCLIVPTDDRNQVVGRHYYENPEGVVPKGSDYSDYQGHVQLLTDRFFEGVAESVKQQRQVLTYESCFYFGSSGSPVFDEHCNVVAMHSAGYPFRNARGESQSVIEYGYPLSSIIEHIIVQLVEKGRFDVLQKYLACSYERRHNLMTNLKKLVESRNLTAFKNAVANSVVTSDENLKTFFAFLSRREEPVPMDTA
ncbi:serine protease FAM111A-like [Symphorus nematophorus]